MKLLITGGAGFIGSNLAGEFSKSHEVIVLDNLSTGSKKNLEGIECELIEGDIRDFDTVISAAEGCECIFHEAALPSVARSVENPEKTNEVNVTGTLNILRAARKAGCRRVIFASSSSAYGNTPTLPKKETMNPSPLSPYAVSKLSGEYYCRAFYEVYGLETISLRYFNVFGKKQNPDSQYAAVIPKFITSVLDGKRPEIYGDGEQTRDFTHISNVVQANKLAMEKGGNGETVNIGAGDRKSLNELAEIICKLAGKDLEPTHSPPRKGDVRDSQADISRAKELLGYSPNVSFEEGLEKSIEWYKGKQK